MKQVSMGACADNLDAAGNALHLGRRIGHIDRNSISCFNLPIVVDALMNHADQVRLVRILQIEGECPLRVGFGAGFLLRALIGGKKNYFVAGCGLAMGLVANYAFNGVGCEARRKRADN